MTDPRFSKYATFVGEYAQIPEVTQYALYSYIVLGQPVGHFLFGVLTNDLQRTFGHADLESQRSLPAIVRWVYNVAPSDCWGNADNVDKWIRKRGIDGISRTPVAAET